MKKLLIKKQSLSTKAPKSIHPRLFVSNYSFAIDKKFLSSENITLVISCVKIHEKDRFDNVKY